MREILVLCIGNICRSPMAEGLLKRALPDRIIRSAGVGALIGKPADPLSVKLMDEEGVDISDHCAQQVSSRLISQADLILVMDLEQKKYIESHFVGARGKVFRLCEDRKIDVPDPYREGIESFRVAQKLIEEGVKFWVGQIKKMD
jgi:protein-tyrosine phosphatase